MSTETSSSQLPVLIIGAGISGLTLGQGLLKTSIPFRIFERDPSLHQRAQGYRVRINSVGIDALSSTLSPSLLDRLKKSCALNLGGGGVPKMHSDALTGQRRQPSGISGPRGEQPGLQPDAIDSLNADRSVLRSVLAHDLEPHIELGREFVSYETQKGGSVIVRFVDGNVASGCLLVGADGARSRVSKQFLRDHVLFDTQARCIYGKTPLTPELQNRLSSNAMTGLTLVQDRSGHEERPLSLLLEPIRFQDNEYRSQLPDNYVYWVLFGRKENYAPADDSTLLKLEPGQAGKLAQSMTRHWHESFQALFELQDFHRGSMIRLASAPPQIPQWPANGLITLIGDAIHPMSPTAVVGAVSAIRDAANLSALIAENGVNAESIGKYEASMRIYAGEAISRSLLGGKMMFGMKAFEELEVIAVYAPLAGEVESGSVPLGNVKGELEAIFTELDFMGDTTDAISVQDILAALENIH